jgi:hypothetical protein
MRTHFDDIAAGEVEPTFVISAVQRNSVDHFDKVKKRHRGKIIDVNGITILRASIPSKADYGGNVDSITSKHNHIRRCLPSLIFSYTGVPRLE